MHQTDQARRHATIRAVLLDIVNEVAGPCEHLSDDQSLVDQLGLSSLHLARIVAVLELELDIDPFSELVPITSVRTVGDLIRVYDLAATGQPEPDPVEPVAGGRRGDARGFRDVRTAARGQRP